MANHNIPPFFKVLINDFTRHIKLPPYLVLNHGNVLPKHVKLRMSNGVTWEMTIGKRKDGSRCLTRGWSEFVKDMKLVAGDYVCFYPNTDRYTFDVVVFGANCYEKKMPVFGSEVNHDRAPSPHFQVVLKDWHRPRLPLRKEFVKKAGLVDVKKVTLEYGPTKETSVVLVDNRSKKGAFKFELALGWHDFQKDNRLRVGKTYSFTFINERNMIQVQPVETLVRVAVVETAETDTSESSTSESSGSDEY